MAYQVSDLFHKKSYSGESLYKVDLKINNESISSKHINKITISDPIIDKTSNVFYIGTFIAKKLVIKFRDINNLNISSGDEVYLQIGQYINNEFEYCTIGYLYIDNLEKNYYENYEITCYDKSIFFKKNVDYSSCFTDGKATIDTILQEVCNICGVTLDINYPKTNGIIEIGTYDSTISGKQWISYIAEIKGCNAKIGRDGILYLIPIKSTPNLSINVLKSKSWKLGEKYKISKVVYFDALRNFTYGDDTNNTLYIRQDNPFIENTNTISNIYDIVKDTEIYNFKIENYGDVSLDSWDNITYSLREQNYTSISDITIQYYSGGIYSTNECVIPTKQQEVTTNVIGGDIKQTIKKVRTEVNNIEGTVKIFTQSVNEIDSRENNNYQEIINKFNDYTPTSDFVTLENSVTQLQTDTYTKTEINTKLTDGSVTKVNTIRGTIDENGMTYKKTDAPTSTTINEKGVKVNDIIGSEGELLFAGYDEELKQTIVRTDNLSVKNHLILDNKSRIQSYETGTGIFWVGD